MKDFLNNLYDKFVLRDLLSFITPGFIFIFAMLLYWHPLSTIIEQTGKIHWIIYIPIFGCFYLVGFALHCIGLLLIPFLGTDSCNRGYRIWKDFSIIKEYKNTIDFQNKANDSAIKQMERIIVFKQMCGNNALSILIASFLLAFEGSIIHPIWLAIGMPLSVILYITHCWELKAQRLWHEVNTTK
jgi:hypothetical protein